MLSGFLTQVAPATCCVQPASRSYAFIMQVNLNALYSNNNLLYSRTTSTSIEVMLEQ